MTLTKVIATESNEVEARTRRWAGEETKSDPNHCGVGTDVCPVTE